MSRGQGQIAHHRGPDRARQAPFDDAEGIPAGLAIGGGSGDEGLGLCVRAEPGHGHDMEHRVEAAIAVTIEPVVDGSSIELRGGSGDRSRPGVACEGITGMEAAWVAHFDHQLGGAERSEPEQRR